MRWRMAPLGQYPTHGAVQKGGLIGWLRNANSGVMLNRPEATIAGIVAALPALAVVQPLSMPCAVACPERLRDGPQPHNAVPRRCRQLPAVGVKRNAGDHAVVL